MIETLPDTSILSFVCVCMFAPQHHSAVTPSPSRCFTRAAWTQIFRILLLAFDYATCMCIHSVLPVALASPGTCMLHASFCHASCAHLNSSGCLFHHFSLVSIHVVHMSVPCIWHSTLAVSGCVQTIPCHTVHRFYQACYFMLCHASDSSAQVPSWTIPDVHAYNRFCFVHMV